MHVSFISSLFRRKRYSLNAAYSDDKIPMNSPWVRHCYDDDDSGTATATTNNTAKQWNHFQDYDI